MAATAHLPKHQPKAENELPQGIKNWDKPPQQVDGPAAPEPHPTPEEAGAGETNSRKKPQQVQAPKSQREIDEGEPSGEADSDRRPQQVDGPEGPDPSDGSELIEAATSHESVEIRKGGPTGIRAKKSSAPAKSSGPKANDSK